jgi:hypothetical protein
MITKDKLFEKLEANKLYSTSEIKDLFKIHWYCAYALMTELMSENKVEKIEAGKRGIYWRMKNGTK